MIGKWREFRLEYRKVERQLQSLEISLRWTFEELFSQYVESEDELERLRPDEKESIYFKVDGRLLAQRLLPEVHILYGDLLRDLQLAYEHLKKLLGQENPLFQKVLARQTEDQNAHGLRAIVDATQARITYELERLKFSTRGKLVEAALQNINSLLNNIQNLLSQNDKTSARRANEIVRRSQLALRQNLLQFWRHGHAVYELISKLWSCKCHPQRSANLLLLHRSSPSVQLDILFQYSRLSSASGNSSWAKHWACFLAMAERFGEVIELPATASDSQKQDIPQVSDLCRTIANLKADENFIALLTRPDCNDRYTIANPESNNFIQPKVDEFISLGSLLRLDPWERPRRMQRYRIAAILASSHLQLHCSGWLQKGWSEDNVLFLIRDGRPDLEHPYLQRQFVERLAEFPHPNFDIAFTTLSILLLDLCFGCTLDASPFRRKFLLPDGSSDLVLDRTVAWEWSAHVKDEADEHYARAVDWCLNRWRVRADDVTWREDFYQIVVEPLRAESKMQNNA